VGQLVVSFFASLNAGDATNIDKFFAPAGTFQWYSDAASSTSRLGADATDRTTLATYLRKRHSHHEHGKLIELQTTLRGRGDIADFVFALERTADDLAAHKPYTYGKGAAECATGKIMVWSLGGQFPTRGATPVVNACPRPTASIVSDGIVCARVDQPATPTNH
jgi:hypothetical protein